jgi:hypothetical protein
MWYLIWYPIWTFLQAELVGLAEARIWLCPQRKYKNMKICALDFKTEPGRMSICNRKISAVFDKAKSMSQDEIVG